MYRTQIDPYSMGQKDVLGDKENEDVKLCQKMSKPDNKSLDIFFRLYQKKICVIFVS